MKSKKRAKASAALLLGSCAAILFLTTSGPSLAAPYKLAPGDTIEITIGGLLINATARRSRSTAPSRFREAGR